MEHRVQIDLQQAVPLVVGHSGKAGTVAAAGAGVGETGVHAAEGGDCLGERIANGGAVGDVDLLDMDAAAGGDEAGEAAAF
jgi:hypothetical protein